MATQGWSVSPSGALNQFVRGRWSAGESAPHLGQVSGEAVDESVSVERGDALSPRGGLAQQLTHHLRDRQSSFLSHLIGGRGNVRIESY